MVVPLRPLLGCQRQAGGWPQIGFNGSAVEEDSGAADVVDNGVYESSPVALLGLQACRMIALATGLQIGVTSRDDYASNRLYAVEEFLQCIVDQG